MRNAFVFAMLFSAACGSSDREPGPSPATEQTASGSEATEAHAGERRDAPAPSRAAPEGLLAAGTAAPDFSAPDQTGATHTLADERGHVVVLYFYPRDMTPGCTREACAFRDAWDRYQQAGVTVFGVSTDDVDSHRAFAQEHELPFSLLADPDGHIADAYGVRHAGGFDQRVTFVIDGSGTIAHVFERVDPGVHADEVLSVIAAL